MGTLSLQKMKRTLGIISIVCTVLTFAACSGGSSKSSHAYAGTFITDTGITFTLNEDSTTNIVFRDGIQYQSTWEVVKRGGDEWAIIEFSGNKQYYFLKNGKIYHSHMEMDLDKFGSKVTYQKP